MSGLPAIGHSKSPLRQRTPPEAPLVTSGDGGKCKSGVVGGDKFRERDETRG